MGNEAANFARAHSAGSRTLVNHQLASRRFPLRPRRVTTLCSEFIPKVITEILGCIAASDAKEFGERGNEFTAVSVAKAL